MGKSNTRRLFLAQSLSPSLAGDVNEEEGEYAMTEVGCVDVVAMDRIEK